MQQDIVRLFEQNPVVAIAVAIIVGIILLVVVITLLGALLKALWWIVTLPFQIIVAPFRVLAGKPAKDIGKPYKGGWGWYVKGGGDKDHISITNKKADVGKGAHITTKTEVKELPKIHDHFDDKGNYLGSEF